MIESSAHRVPQNIGPLGRLARLGVGVALIALALFWRDPEWRDAVLGLVVMPAVALGALALRARHSPEPLRATGPVGHAVNFAIAVALLMSPATAGGAFLFFGSTMLAAREQGGCEVTVVSNALLGRDDQVGCALFAPVDLAEAAVRGRPARAQ